MNIDLKAYEPFDIKYCTLHGEKCPDLKTAIENNKRVFWYECMNKKCVHPIYSERGEVGFRGIAPKFCDFCGKNPTESHAPDCPIALHKALMEKIEREGL
jgi:hypothetical protein